MFSGMGKEVENLIMENNELLATKWVTVWVSYDSLAMHNGVSKIILQFSKACLQVVLSLFIYIPFTTWEFWTVLAVDYDYLFQIFTS
jgi:hypothetical protein